MARLVIVDDDLAIHDLLKVFFEDLGHEVTCFENLTAASTYIIENGSAIDLIVSDLRLPDGTGLCLMPVISPRHTQSQKVNIFLELCVKSYFPEELVHNN